MSKLKLLLESNSVLSGRQIELPYKLFRVELVVDSGSLQVLIGNPRVVSFDTELGLLGAGVVPL
ncbi:hypothetical protein os1_28820 [Comamonadaceae bacterium OS-1]|nr:hypothetical protein os1_28820 [Comamonadaceae bacterium OS-1]